MVDTTKINCIKLAVSHTHVCPLSADRSNEINRYRNPNTVVQLSAIKKNVIYPAQDILLYLLPVSAAPWNRDFTSVTIRSECSLPTHLHAVNRRPYFHQEESLVGATTVFVVPEA